MKQYIYAFLTFPWGLIKIHFCVVSIRKEPFVCQYNLAPIMSNTDIGKEEALLEWVMEWGQA